MREAIKARLIITAVNIPNVENKGIGAKPIIKNPNVLDIADPSKANPVPFIELCKAFNLSDVDINSSLNLMVIWIAKSTPTPNEMAPIVAVT